MNTKSIFCSAFALFLLFGSMAVADVSLPSVIGDNMVLQRDAKIPIWGWADEGEKVTVSFAGQEESATACAAGEWKVSLKPVKAGGPHEMKISGKNEIVVKNILVGEVWVCSGQSNMEWPVNRSNDAEEEVAKANYPKIRLFMANHTIAAKPQDNVGGSWNECSPETVGGFSAVGYFFGRDLHKELDVPIGLIKSAWGGTPAESWTTAEAMQADPDFKPILDRWDEAIAGVPAQIEAYGKSLDEWASAAEAAEAEGNPVPEMPKAPADPRRNPHRDSGLFNGMIAPLIPFSIQGAIWYQGESNASRAYQYRDLFPAMIQSWRDSWGLGDFPFLFVQLANFMETKPEPGDSAWAELREAQTMTLSLPKTGMAVIIDIGEAKDIHPRNKQDVGKRLALAAQSIAYGQKDVVYSGPMYESMEKEDGKIRLTFGHVGGGLEAKGSDTLKGFAIAGEDKAFVWADAKIDGDTVVVSSDKVANPVAVRYAWADNPVCNLYNKEGLPASPFRTDDWPGVTVDNR